jgi:hypothetical protein
VCAEAERIIWKKEAGSTVTQPPPLAENGGVAKGSEIKARATVEAQLPSRRGRATSRVPRPAPTEAKMKDSNFESMAVARNETTATPCGKGST